ncbi:MAG TPA: tetratricopeptide repeat protein [Blastocatellia bacterium]|nr:tetratricopeptide repeat protein [Blastocatellia bacterium]
MTKSDKTTSLQSAADSHRDLGFQRVKSVYTVREISELFGLPPRVIRRWTGAGLIRSIPAEEGGDPLYDFRALTQFRRIREMRASGMTAAQIDVQLGGQLNLFEAGQGQLVAMPSRMSPFEEGLLLHEKGDPKAEDRYRKSIQDGEYVADAYCNLGLLRYDAGDYLKAVDCLTLSLKDDPRHFESHFNLANLYFDAGDLRLARLHYEIAIQIEPCFAHLHFNLGLVHIREGDLDRAIAALRKCEELAPEDERPEVEGLLFKLAELKSRTVSR